VVGGRGMALAVWLGILRGHWTSSSQGSGSGPSQAALSLLLRVAWSTQSAPFRSPETALHRASSQRRPHTSLGFALPERTGLPASRQQIPPMVADTL